MRRLTERQCSILTEMAWRPQEWLLPRDVGSHSRSFHSNVLLELLRHGLVERQLRTRRDGGPVRTYVYRISEPGLAAWNAAVEDQ